MATKFIVAHRADPNNVGDIASNPLQYFLKNDEYDTIDVADLSKIKYSIDLPLIVGGGGLIGNEFIGESYLSDLLRSPDAVKLEKLWEENWVLDEFMYKEEYDDFHKKFHDLISSTIEKIKPITAPRFVWGAGHNSNTDIDFLRIKWPKALSGYKLIGIRDYHEASRFPWVPCASCMHIALNKKYRIKNDIIWFEHKKQLIRDFGNDPIPRFINSGNNVEQTIELLGSANTILTNSYHGAYWGTLLNKRVIVVGGTWSSKFKWFKYKPFVLDKKDDWRNYLDEPFDYSDALDDCRVTTIDWWRQIREMS